MFHRARMGKLFDGGKKFEGRGEAAPFGDKYEVEIDYFTRTLVDLLP